MTKFKEILGSSRFQQMILIAILQSLVLFNVITSDQGTGLINIISYLFGASVLIRTVDRNAGDAKSATTVSIPNNVSSVSASVEK